MLFPSNNIKSTKSYKEFDYWRKEKFSDILNSIIPAQNANLFLTKKNGLI